MKYIKIIISIAILIAVASCGQQETEVSVGHESEGVNITGEVSSDTPAVQKSDSVIDDGLDLGTVELDTLTK